MSVMNGPLSRFRVLDLTRALAGPAAVRQLADWGADCIKIEVPTDDPNPPDEMSPRLGSYFQNAHRNKRSLTLNLRDERGRTIFYDLVKQADVVVENYRPGVKHRLKIDYETLKEMNPKIVYASISAFGQEGPYVDRPGFDQIIQGMGGLMSATGFPGNPPTRAGIAVSDLSSGLYCSIGILVALLDREVTGKGRWVRTSLIEAMIAMMDFQAARWLTEGEIPSQVGNDHPTNFPMSAYETADSAMNIAPMEETMWHRFCEVIGRPDLAENSNYANERLRLVNKEALRSEIVPILLRKTTAEWIAAMNAAGVPCGPIYRMDQVFADEQVEKLSIVEEVQHPKIDRLRLIRQPVRLEDEPQRIAAPVPDRGFHTNEILQGIGLTENSIAELRAAGVV
ncbi:CaiB/BaiF CoA transferase family protein [Sinorhizobium meliloti]|uniref:CaiB/BaiF CoA transferase family protein n=1 Tax=Rhizobium meliloti TaxID=382 RepID=UPI003D6588DE